MSFDEKKLLFGFVFDGHTHSMGGGLRPALAAAVLTALTGVSALHRACIHSPALARARVPPPVLDLECSPSLSSSIANQRQRCSSPCTLRQVFSSAELCASLDSHTSSSHTHTTPLTVVLFGSKSCASCRAVLSRLRQLDHTLEQVRFLHLNLAEETRDAFVQRDVTHMPTAYVYDASGGFIESHLCQRSGLRRELHMHLLKEKKAHTQQHCSVSP